MGEVARLADSDAQDSAVALAISDGAQHGSSSAVAGGPRSTQALGALARLSAGCCTELGGPTGHGSSSSLAAGASQESKARSVANWKRGAKAARMYAEATARVAQDNKTGATPEGVYAAAAMALQLHVAAEGRRGSHAGGPADADEAAARPPGVWEAPAGDLFVRARQACGFAPARYYATLGAQARQTKPTLRLLGASSASGRSGAFFFITPDQQFFIKTCTRSDWRALLRILPAYVEHLESAREHLNRSKLRGRSTESLLAIDARRSNASSASGHQLGAEHDGQPEHQLEGFVDTLLPRYLGLYRFQADGDAKPVRVVVMTNVFAGAVSIDRRYDLKGSTYGRTASERECRKSAPIFKDLDWKSKEPAFELAASSRDKLIATLERDAAFLSRHKLIDYSLLLGIHERKGVERRPTEGMLVTTVADESRLAYIGLVDVLTPYSAKKRAETLFLGRMLWRDISCQPPATYARRFIGFVRDHVLHAKSAEEDAADARNRV